MGSSPSSPLHQEDNKNIMDKALVTLDIAVSLIKKDHFDVRRLGMFSSVLLTDLLKSGWKPPRLRILKENTRSVACFSL